MSSEPGPSSARGQYTLLGADGSPHESATPETYGT